MSTVIDGRPSRDARRELHIDHHASLVPLSTKRSALNPCPDRAEIRSKRADAMAALAS